MVSPFLGDYYLNQSATSQTSIYFAYRDANGIYLDSNSVQNRISITYKYKFSPFIFLPNVTTCGYIGAQDERWEDSSCLTIFSRANGTINCQCRHMSYYSIIDDYLVRPNRFPIVFL